MTAAHKSALAMVRAARLAELVANGQTVAEAGRNMGLSKGQTSNTWNGIKRDLGEQAV